MKAVLTAAAQMALQFALFGLRIAAAFAMVLIIIRLANGGQIGANLLIDPFLFAGLGFGGAGFIVGWAMTAGGADQRIKFTGLIALTLPVIAVIIFLAAALVGRMGTSILDKIPLGVAVIIAGFTFILFSSASVVLYCLSARTFNPSQGPDAK